MSRRFDQIRPTPRQLERWLDDLGLTIRDFSFLAGVDPRRIERWIKDPSQADQIPQWVAGFLYGCGNPDVRRFIRLWADQYVEFGEKQTR